MNNSGCSKEISFFQRAAFKENVAVDNPLGKQMKYSGAQIAVRGPVLQFLIFCSLPSTEKPNFPIKLPTRYQKLAF